IPYDLRVIRDDANDIPRADYSETPHYPAREQLVARLRRTAAEQGWRHRIHFGLLLSGGARIYSSRFRDEFVRDCGVGRGGIVVGGEMEGVGFLSTCAPDDPRWVVVKGISDFADEPHHARPRDYRREAC